MEVLHVRNADGSVTTTYWGAQHLGYKDGESVTSMPEMLTSPLNDEPLVKLNDRLWSREQLLEKFLPEVLPGTGPYRVEFLLGGPLGAWFAFRCDATGQGWHQPLEIVSNRSINGLLRALNGMPEIPAEAPARDPNRTWAGEQLAGEFPIVARHFNHFRRYALERIEEPPYGYEAYFAIPSIEVTTRIWLTHKEVDALYALPEEEPFGLRENVNHKREPGYGGSVTFTCIGTPNRVVVLDDEDAAVPTPPYAVAPHKVWINGKLDLHGVDLRANHPDPFAKWPSCHKCSEKAGRYVPVKRYDVIGLEDYGMTMRVKVECHNEKWTHEVRLADVQCRSDPFALFAPGYDE